MVQPFIAADRETVFGRHRMAPLSCEPTARWLWPPRSIPAMLPQCYWR